MRNAVSITDLPRVRTSDLKPHPRNSRVHDVANIQAICKSLKTFGQQSPIIYNAKGYVLKGNGTLCAAKELGWKRVHGILARDLTPEQELAYAIADNKTSDLSKFDFQVLRDVLGDLKSVKDFDLASTGFSSMELAPLFSDSWKEHPGAEKGVDSDETAVHFTAKEWAELVQVTKEGAFPNVKSMLLRGVVIVNKRNKSAIDVLRKATREGKQVKTRR
jgi:hypothetical protein